MNVHELSREQLRELKVNHMVQQGSSLSWYEIANIDDFMTDDEIFNLYEGTDFVEDDFCN